ncbi:MAG TPA: glycine oxidase maturase GoxB [Candidatus Elarobacter sp.]|jgi:flavin-dependent dehydrogenase
MTLTRAAVVVVGGGAAGAAAALTLAQRGVSACLIAPRAPHGDRPGESLAPAANSLLRELGVAEAFAAGPHRESNATYASWGAALLAQRNAIGSADGPGHVIDRPAFERLLLRAVVRAGVPVVEDAVTGAIPSSLGWSIALEHGGRVDARFAIDASGRAAVLARDLAARRRADRLVGAYAFLRQADHEIEPTPATLIEAVAGGWWYATLLPDFRIALAFFSDPDGLPRRLTADAPAWTAMVRNTLFVQRWIESAGYVVESAPRIASAATTWLEHAAGPAWAAAGDAAASFDPLSSHGLTTALWTGRRAALAAADALAGDLEAPARYATTLRRAIDDVLAQRQAIYAEERRFSGQPFWDRRARGHHDVSGESRADIRHAIV